MSLTRPTDLFYGHLGEAIYDNESHKWHFNRVPQITRKIRPLGTPSTVLQPLIKQGSLGDTQRAADRTESFKKLARSFPELVPGISFFPKLTQESEIIRKAASCHDPATSNLFAFGKAKDQSLGYWTDRSRPKEVPVIAVAGGAAGDAVRLIRLGKERVGWEGNKSVRLTNFLLKNQEQGWWFTNGTPVQQLCFAETRGKAKARLAVRYHGAITVLEPLLHADAVPARSFHDSKLRRTQHPEARLDANPVLTLYTGDTGCSPHSDVSFNPWRTSQFAVVDQLGHWTVWELKPTTHLLDGKTVVAGPSGFISDEKADAPESSFKNDSGDGWGSILWAGSKNTVVVADRTTLSVFSIEDGTKRLHVPMLAKPKNTDWNLDMKRSPSVPAHIFLLTSTRVIWLRIVPDDDSRSGGNSEPGATILLSWVHFRDQEDISLRLNVLEDEETMVVLYSRLTSLSTIFTFGMLQSPLTIPLSLSDPYLLPLVNRGYDSILHSHQRSSAETTSVSSLELRVIKYEVQKGSTPSGLGALYRERAVRFYQLSIFYSDLSLQQCVYVGHTTTDPSHFQLLTAQNREDILKTPMLISEAGFVVPNRVSAEEWIDPNSVESEAVTQLRKEGGRYKPHLDKDPWTLNFEWLEREIQSLSRRISSNQNAEKSSRANLDTGLEKIFAATESKLKNGAPQLQLLIEMLNTTIHIEDIDVASKTLEDFVTMLRNFSVNTEEDEKNVMYNFPNISEILRGQISTLVLPSTTISKTSSLSQIYDSLLRSWISPLPEIISSRVRIAAEKNVREVALQLYLAGLGVQLGSRVVGDKLIPQQSLSSGDSLFHLPLRDNPPCQTLSAKQLENSRGRSSSPLLVSSQISEDTGFILASSGGLPTPDPTPSLRSKSPASSLLGPEDPACRRLRALASLAPQPALPTSASHILRHWFEGSDPATYDFEATERALKAELEPEDSDDDATTTKKRQRVEKRLKRQRERSIASSSQPEITRVKTNHPLPVSVPLPAFSQDENMKPRSLTTERPLWSSQMGMSALGGSSAGQMGRGKGKPGKKRPPGFR